VHVVSVFFVINSVSEHYFI